MATATSKELKEAARAGDTLEVLRLLKQNPRDERNLRRAATALVPAVKKGHYNTAKALLDYGADPNLGREGPYTPLLLACEQNHSNLVKLLVQYGADVNLGFWPWMTPLTSYLHNSYSYTSHSLGNSPSERCDYETVKSLVEHGADVNVAPQGYTPLHHVISRCHPEVVQLLIDNGALLEPDDHSPLSYALSRVLRGVGDNVTIEPKAIEVIKVLLAAGADPSRPSGPGLLTPLEGAQSFADRYDFYTELNIVGLIEEAIEKRKAEDTNS